MPDRGDRIDLGIRGLHAAVGDHIAYFWETESQFTEAVDFLRVGLAASDHAVVFGHEEANRAVLRVLQRTGHDVEALQRAGRLSVAGPEPSGEAMLASLGATFQRAVDAGAPLIRLLGNIGWGRAGWPADDDIIRFEARVTGAAAQFPSVVVCMYDLKTLDGRIVVHCAFGTHPLTIYRNVVRENPLYVPLDEFLTGLDEARDQPAA